MTAEITIVSCGAAIQGLNEKLTLELDNEQADIDRLTVRFVALKQRLVSVEASMD